MSFSCTCINSCFAIGLFKRDVATKIRIYYYAYTLFKFSMNMFQWYIENELLADATIK